MNKHIYCLAALLILSLHAFSARAQYTTATQDGNISAAEYGGSSNTFGSWYMTWDATNLYIAKTGGQAAEPNIVYLDLNPLLPVTGGDNTSGNTIGNSDYGVTPKMPFRADTRIFFSDSYIEIRRRDNLGNWSGIILSGMFISNTGTNREVSVSWASLTGGGSIPTAFNWLGYAVNIKYGNDNFRYALAPTNDDAAGTNGGTTPPLSYYYTVGHTSDQAVTKPFQQRSYTFLGTNSVNDFGDISVWDFTMNTGGLQISRGTTHGN